MAPDCKCYGEMMGNQRKQPVLSTVSIVWKIQIFDMDKNKILIVKSLVRKIYRLPLYFPLFLKFPVCLCVYIYGVKELVFSLYTSLK